MTVLRQGVHRPDLEKHRSREWWLEESLVDSEVRR